MTLSSCSLSKSFDKLKLWKFSKIITYHDGLLPVTQHDILMMWSLKIMWQTKIKISPKLKSLWPLNLEGWWLTLRGFYPLGHSMPWTGKLARSRGKLKTFYSISTTTVILANKLASLETHRKEFLSYSHMSFNQVVLLDHGTVWKFYNSFENLWPLNLVGCWPQRGGLAWKVLNNHRLLVVFVS